jgi:hypothetical protein
MVEPSERMVAGGSIAPASIRNESYDGVAKPRNVVRDLAIDWERFRPLAELPGAALVSIEWFCGAKTITVDALEQLETRARIDRHGGITLAYPRYCRTGTGDMFVCGVRLRPLDPDRKKSAVPGSAFAPPALPGIVAVSNPSGVYVVEGETDAAKIWILTGGAANIIVLGGTVGAKHAAWDRYVAAPGVPVYVALDSDRRHPGEPRSVFRGEEAAAELLVRYRRRGIDARRLAPPGKDWCE